MIKIFINYSLFLIIKNEIEKNRREHARFASEKIIREKIKMFAKTLL